MPLSTRQYLVRRRRRLLELAQLDQCPLLGQQRGIITCARIDRHEERIFAIVLIIALAAADNLETKAPVKALGIFIALPHFQRDENDRFRDNLAQVVPREACGQSPGFADPDEWRWCSHALRQPRANSQHGRRSRLECSHDARSRNNGPACYASNSRRYPSSTQGVT